MGRIANILDLPFDQKFLIVSTCLSVERLCQLAVQRGENEEVVMEQALDYVKEQLGSEIQEAKINSFLKKYFDGDTLTF
jgi:hypothetical protein